MSRTVLRIWHLQSDVCECGSGYSSNSKECLKPFQWKYTRPRVECKNAIGLANDQTSMCTDRDQIMSTYPNSVSRDRLECEDIFRNPVKSWKNIQNTSSFGSVEDFFLLLLKIISRSHDVQHGQLWSTWQLILWDLYLFPTDSDIQTNAKFKQNQENCNSHMQPWWCIFVIPTPLSRSLVELIRFSFQIKFQIKYKNSTVKMVWRWWCHPLL